LIGKSARKGRAFGTQKLVTLRAIYELSGDSSRSKRHSVSIKATATRATFTARNPRQMKLKKYAPWSLNEDGHTEQ
jgi:hypothetical protein